LHRINLMLNSLPQNLGLMRCLSFRFDAIIASHDFGCAAGVIWWHRNLILASFDLMIASDYAEIEPLHENLTLVASRARPFDAVIGVDDVGIEAIAPELHVDAMVATSHRFDAMAASNQFDIEAIASDFLSGAMDSTSCQLDALIASDDFDIKAIASEFDSDAVGQYHVGSLQLLHAADRRGMPKTATSTWCKNLLLM
jgi:hypothetical protein